MGEICAHTLYADSLLAVEALHSEETSEPLERVVEANTLLSGLGFESGGLAAAHAVVPRQQMSPPQWDWRLRSSPPPRRWVQWD